MTPDEIDQARREFLDECDMVVKVPWVWFFAGGPRVNRSGNIFALPLPLYTSVGITRAEDSRIKARWPSPQGHIQETQVPLAISYRYVGAPSTHPQFDYFQTCMEVALVEHWDNKLCSVHGGHPADWKSFFDEDAIVRIHIGEGRRHFRVWLDAPPPAEDYSGDFDLEEFDYGLHLASSLIAYARQPHAAPDLNTLLYDYALATRAGTIDNLFTPVGPPFDTPPSRPESFQHLVDALKQIFVWTAHGHTHSFAFLPAILGSDKPYAPTVIAISTGGADEFFFEPMHDSRDSKAHNAMNSLLESLSWRTFSRPVGRLKGSDMLIVWWQGASRGLFGPAFRPMFAGDSRLPAFFSIDIHMDEPYRRIRYNRPYLGLIGPSHSLDVSRGAIEETQLGWILYDSRRMGWEVKGARVLKEEEYKKKTLPPPATTITVASEPSNEAATKSHYARVWTNDPDLKPELTRKEFDDLRSAVNAKKFRYKIFVVDSGQFENDGVGDVYLNSIPVSPHLIANATDITKEQKRFTQLPYRILVRTLKGGGEAGELIDLVRLWFNPQFTKELIASLEARQAWRNSKQESTQEPGSKQEPAPKRDIAYIQSTKAKVSKECSTLNALLRPYLGFRVISKKKGRWRLTSVKEGTRMPLFCYLELPRPQAPR
jgi:hypothetical protein